MDWDQQKVDMILDKAKTQPEPLKRGGDYDNFFETMSKDWHVADEVCR